MKDSLPKALDWILFIEGGLVNDKDDPGGITKYGISKKAYPNLDIAELTKEQAEEIYKRDYWDKAGCDDLNYGYDLCVFDTAVNMGVKTAVGLQYNCPTYQEYLLRRIAKYVEITKKNANLNKFFRGWVIRCIRLMVLIEGA